MQTFLYLNIDLIRRNLESFLYNIQVIYKIYSAHSYYIKIEKYL